MTDLIIEGTLTIPAWFLILVSVLLTITSALRAWGTILEIRIQRLERESKQ